MLKYGLKCKGCRYRLVEFVCVKCRKAGNKFIPKLPTLPQEQLKPKRQPKYRNRVFERNGEKYRSEKEYNRHMMLKASIGVSNLRREVPYELIPSVILNGRKKPPIRYIADFEYIQLYEDGFERQGMKKVVEDVKSPITRKNPVYRLKKHLMKHIFNIDIIET